MMLMWADDMNIYTLFFFWIKSWSSNHISVLECKDLLVIKDLCKSAKLNTFCAGDKGQGKLIDKVNSQSKYRMQYSVLEKTSEIALKRICKTKGETQCN